MADAKAIVLTDQNERHRALALDRPIALKHDSVLYGPRNKGHAAVLTRVRFRFSARNGETFHSADLRPEMMLSVMLPGPFLSS